MTEIEKQAHELYAAHMNKHGFAAQDWETLDIYVQRIWLNHAKYLLAQHEGQP